MELYLAVTGEREPELISYYKMGNVLMSYHYYNNKKELIKELIKKKQNVFIDSGAFSAHNAGAQVSLKEYITWLKEVEPTYYAVLDSMSDPEETLSNQEKMESSGLSPVPVFHTGEGISYLQHYIEKYDYICLGGMVQASNLESWLDKVWREILLKKPDMKVHGFGMTDAYLMTKYPWYSCDSSSFKSGKRFGRIPIYRNKKLTTKSIREFKREFLKICEDEEVIQNNQFINDMMDVIGGLAYINYAKEMKKPNIEGLLSQKTLF